MPMLTEKRGIKFKVVGARLTDDNELFLTFKGLDATYNHFYNIYLPVIRTHSSTAAYEVYAAFMKKNKLTLLAIQDGLLKDRIFIGNIATYWGENSWKTFVKPVIRTLSLQPLPRRTSTPKLLIPLKPPPPSSVPVEIVKNGQQLSFLKAAQQVLEATNCCMHVDDIWSKMKENGFISKGKTPVATLGSNIYTHIKNNGEKSLFFQKGPSLFGLTQWQTK